MEPPLDARRTERSPGSARPAFHVHDHSNMPSLHAPDFLAFTEYTPQACTLAFCAQTCLSRELSASLWGLANKRTGSGWAVVQDLAGRIDLRRRGRGRGRQGYWSSAIWSCRCWSSGSPPPAGRRDGGGDGGPSGQGQVPTADDRGRHGREAGHAGAGRARLRARARLPVRRGDPAVRAALDRGRSRGAREREPGPARWAARAAFGDPSRSSQAARRPGLLGDPRPVLARLQPDRAARQRCAGGAARCWSTTSSGPIDLRFALWRTSRTASPTFRCCSWPPSAKARMRPISGL